LFCFILVTAPDVAFDRRAVRVLVVNYHRKLIWVFGDARYKLPDKRA
jgi:hypothetical protein